MSVCNAFQKWAREAVDEWDGQETYELFLAILQKTGETHKETFWNQMQAMLDEVRRLKALNESLAKRVAAQSELLSRRAERGETYTIKPLEWEKRTDFWVANTALGLLVACPGRWHSQRLYGSGNCDSCDHGKALAEAWYRARLGEALTRVEQ